MQIKKKIKAGDYGGSVQDLFGDLNAMFDNCKLYNRKDSNLYKDGCKLQKICQAKYEELTVEDEEDSGEMEVDSEGKGPSKQARKRMRVMYNAVHNFRNEDGIPIVGMFMEKPSKKEYPDYYEVITRYSAAFTLN